MNYFPRLKVVLFRQAQGMPAQRPVVSVPFSHAVVDDFVRRRGSMRDRSWNCGSLPGAGGLDPLELQRCCRKMREVVRQNEGADVLVL